MAKAPREQQKTDAERVPDRGTGKLDADNSRLPEEERPEHTAASLRTSRKSPSGPDARGVRG
jgi:hypothetical protein